MIESLEGADDGSIDCAGCIDPIKQQIASDLQRIALSILEPFYRCAAWTAHALTPIRPGKFDNAPTYLQEVIARVVKCSLSILLAPFGVAGFAISGALEWAADLLLPSDFTHWTGAKQQQTWKDSYSIFSLNACLLWGPLPQFFGGVSPAEQRVDHIAGLILSQDADFVFLQEVSSPAAQRLYAKLKEGYAHFYTRIGPSPFLKMETGLFVASKYPINHPRFMHLPSGGILKRGLFYFETPSSWIMTTHLEAGKGSESKAIREKQLSLILGTIQKLKQESFKPCLIAGDFNIARIGNATDEYESLNLSRHFYDPYAENHSVYTEKSATCTDRLAYLRTGSPLPEEEADAVIDYVFLDHQSREKARLEVELVDTYDLTRPWEALSDHRGLKSTLHLESN